MAVEAGPSTLGGVEPARRNLQPTVGGKTPQKEFLKAGESEEAPKVLTRDHGPLQDLPVPKEH